jgi:hypothetical protein
MAQDEFDDAKSEYLGMEDLDGRLLLIWALDIRKDMPGTNGTYDAIEARYAILDGDVNDRITAVPLTVDDGLFSAGQFVGKLKHRLGGRPLLGRVNSQPSRANKKVSAYGFGDPTEADKAVARAYLASVPKVDEFA